MSQTATGNRPAARTELRETKRVRARATRKTTVTAAIALGVRTRNAPTVVATAFEAQEDGIAVS